MISFEDVVDAAARIAEHVRVTPVIEAKALKERLSDASVSLKLECLQATGSFKARGATNKLLSMTRESVAKGIVTASGGNHGLATARAGWLAGVSATIFLPANVAPSKVEKLRSWGATVEIVGEVWDDSNEAALEHAKRTGGVYFHPFADPLVVAGQGTVALELLDQAPAIDTLLVAIGGGGLISGMAVAAKALKPSIRIIGIEPTGAPTLHASLRAGRVVTLDRITTSVPTMAARRTDERVFEVVRRYVDDIILVTDDEMKDAARWLWFELGIASDLSGAAAVAALRTGRLPTPRGAHFGTLVCGAGPDGII
jgi:threonine dehydratase